MRTKSRAQSTQSVTSITGKFLERFKEKTNFVSKEGVVCILFKLKDDPDPLDGPKRAKSLNTLNHQGLSNAR